MNKQDITAKRLEKKNKKLLESKRKNNIKTIKYVTIFIAIQLIVLIFFGLIFYESRHATIDNTQTVIGYADFVQKKHRSIPRVIYIDSIGYRFDDDVYLFFQEDKASNLTDKLSNEKLIITYYKGYGWRYNIIVDIRSDNKIYYTMEDYNKYNQRINVLNIIVVVVVELIYLFFLFLAVFLMHNSSAEIKEQFKKLRKQQLNNKAD